MILHATKDGDARELSMCWKEVFMCTPSLPLPLPDASSQDSPTRDSLSDVEGLLAVGPDLPLLQGDVGEAPEQLARGWRCRRSAGACELGASASASPMRPEALGAERSLPPSVAA